MLTTPRSYRQLQILEQTHKATDTLLFSVGWRVSPEVIYQARRMLVVHQVGSVKIGEIVR